MEFRDFVEIEESRRIRALAGAAMLGAAAVGLFSRHPPRDAAKVEDNENSRRMYERLKDENKFYDSATMKRLVSMARNGDDWAVREIAWPEDHKLHKLGRPFFRNSEAHPKGLKFHSGFEGD